MSYEAGYCPADGDYYGDDGDYYAPGGDYYDGGDAGPDYYGGRAEYNGGGDYHEPHHPEVNQPERRRRNTARPARSQWTAADEFQMKCGGKGAGGKGGKGDWLRMKGGPPQRRTRHPPSGHMPYENFDGYNRYEDFDHYNDYENCDDYDDAEDFDAVSQYTCCLGCVRQPGHDGECMDKDGNDIPHRDPREHMDYLLINSFLEAVKVEPQELFATVHAFKGTCADQLSEDEAKKQLFLMTTGLRLMAAQSLPAGQWSSMTWKERLQVCIAASKPAGKEPVDTPIEANVLYRKYMLSQKPQIAPLDIAKSTFGNLRTFLDYLQAQQMLLLDPGREPVVRAIHRSACEDYVYKPRQIVTQPPEPVDVAIPYRQRRVSMPGPGRGRMSMPGPGRAPPPARPQVQPHAPVNNDCYGAELQPRQRRTSMPTQRPDNGDHGQSNNRPWRCRNLIENYALDDDEDEPAQLAEPIDNAAVPHIEASRMRRKSGNYNASGGFVPDVDDDCAGGMDPYAALDEYDDYYDQADGNPANTLSPRVNENAHMQYKPRRRRCSGMTAPHPQQPYW